VGGAVRSRIRTLPSSWLPFADIGTADVPFSRFLRLSMFQLSVGMVQTLFIGTLNRVMIVELGVPAALVAIFIAIPLLVAPFRALIGFNSDNHRSVLGWRRVPYLWFGTLLQFGGLAIMPFALLVMTDSVYPYGRLVGIFSSGIAFALAGGGAHTIQTAGLALAGDLATPEKRPRVVALMYVMLLVGTVISAFAFGVALQDFDPIKLIQVIQGAAAITVVISTLSLWKQEARSTEYVEWKKGERRPIFMESWLKFVDSGPVAKLLTAVFLGFMAFNLQDVLLEPYGGEILGLSVAATTALTGIMAVGAVLSFVVGARLMEKGWDPIRVALLGVFVGMAAFGLVTLSSYNQLPGAFRVGTFLIGFGEALFGLGTLSFAMGLRGEAQGMALGAWGAVFATGEGLALFFSGVIKDGVAHLIARGSFPAFGMPRVVPYDVVYLLEIALLLLTVLPLVPLVARKAVDPARSGQQFGLAEYLG
jgi:BCD family chlorophyll transporter-like MFS transporter